MLQCVLMSTAMALCCAALCGPASRCLETQIGVRMLSASQWTEGVAVPFLRTRLTSASPQPAVSPQRNTVDMWLMDWNPRKGHWLFVGVVINNVLNCMPKHLSPSPWASLVRARRLSTSSTVRRKRIQYLPPQEYTSETYWIESLSLVVICIPQKGIHMLQVDHAPVQLTWTRSFSNESSLDREMMEYDIWTVLTPEVSALGFPPREVKGCDM